MAKHTEAQRLADELLKAAIAVGACSIIGTEKAKDQLNQEAKVAYNNLISIIHRQDELLDNALQALWPTGTRKAEEVISAIRAHHGLKQVQDINPLS